MTDIPFQRTMIKHLRVEGYRSLKHVELTDLSPFVIIHGPNGSGKSNIIRAVQLILYWAVGANPLPTRGKTGTLKNVDIPQEYKLTVDDFSRGQLPQIRIILEMQIGHFAERFIGTALSWPISLVLDAVAQHNGEDIEYWFNKADFGQISLLPEATDHSVSSTSPKQVDQPDTVNQVIGQQRQLQFLKVRISELEKQINQVIGESRFGEASSISSRLQEEEKSVRDTEKQIATLESQLSQEKLLLTRVAALLLPSLVQHFSAYRTPFERSRYPGGNHVMFAKTVQDYQLANHLLFATISKDRTRRQSVLELPKRLQRAGLVVEKITPIWNDEQRQAQVLLDIPPMGELPLSQLGTGMQQLVFMLGGMFANPAAVMAIEEPEAHLYKDTMLSLARYFRGAVEKQEGSFPEIDQLWIETHHHAFALTPEYLDVSKDEHGWTQVQKTPRSRSIEHFYEPSTRG